MKDDATNTVMKRRNFIKLSGLGLLTFPFMTKARLSFGTSLTGSKNYWEGPEDGKYCVHRTVYDGQVDVGYIWARLDGWWRRFKIIEVENKFWEWNFQERIKTFDARIAETHTPAAAGPHTPSIATYGNRRGRGDSTFHINNKVVGANVVPKQEHLKRINDEIAELAASDADFKTKMQYLKDIHEQDIWRKDMQVGVEYFSNPDFETHTFLNMMENPAATMCFQGHYNIYESFEIRCIPHIVHMANPQLSADLREMARFPFMLMALFHGDPPEQSYSIPAVIYYHIEEFDNGMNTHGQRVAKTREQKLNRFFA